MPTPISVFMYVEPGTIVPTPPKAKLFDDPNRPTPALTLITVLDTTVDNGVYSVTACQAIAEITAAEWAYMCSLLSDSSMQVRVDLTYDDSAPGNNKPIIGTVGFSKVPLLPATLLAHVESAFHAAETRVGTGVSADVRADISHIRASVDSIKSVVDKLGQR